MDFDAGQPVQERKAPDLWRLPRVLEVRVYRQRFTPPKRVTEKGIDREVHEGVEIEIRVSEPFAIRALGPVLWIGDEPLTVAEGRGKAVYRFLCLTPEALQDGASISLSWNSPSARRERIGYRYTPPAQ